MPIIVLDGTCPGNCARLCMSPCAVLGSELDDDGGNPGPVAAPPPRAVRAGRRLLFLAFLRPPSPYFFGLATHAASLELTRDDGRELAGNRSESRPHRFQGGL